MSKITSLGIIGTGRIARRFVLETKYVDDVELVSIYNPKLESAKIFAEKFKIKSFFDILDAFMENIDSVYIASPHETHYFYAKKALECGKHVLCEKPLVLTKKEAIELYHIAEKKQCVLMEAIKTLYCPGFQQLMEIVKSGIVGDVIDVESTFTKLENPSSRELTDNKYGGSFTELGTYTLLPIIKLLGKNYQSVYFEKILNDNNIDIYSKAYFRYRNALATSKTGLGVKSEGQLVISGTRGYVIVEAPWWKTQSIEVRFEDINKKQKYITEFLGEGLRYELIFFLSLINERKEKELKVLENDAIIFAEIMENFLSYRS